MPFNIILENCKFNFRPAVGRNSSRLRFQFRSHPTRAWKALRPGGLRAPPRPPGPGLSTIQNRVGVHRPTQAWQPFYCKDNRDRSMDNQLQKLEMNSDESYHFHQPSQYFDASVLKAISHRPLNQTPRTFHGLL